MKKIILFLALSLAVFSTGFGQTVVPQKEPQKVDHSGIKHKSTDGKVKKSKSKGKYDKHKHKHKHKHMHHKKKHQ